MLEIPPLTIVDLIVMGILGISAAIAWHRGFMKSVLTVSAWLAAALVAVFLWPAAKPLARSLIQPDTVADILALVGMFCAVLIPTSFVSFRLSEMVRESRAGPLDKSLGFVFGAARGLLVVGLGYLVFASLVPAKAHPEWLREARLLPVVKGTADVLLSLNGKNKKAKAAAEPAEEAVDTKKTNTQEPKLAKPKKQAEPKKEPADKKDTDNEEGGGEKSEAYDAGDRRALDQLVRSSSKP
jgi:membrane protein required for colicin V production